VDEVVKLVLYLASDDSAYMSGSELVIDGGALPNDPERVLAGTRTSRPGRTRTSVC